MARAGMDVHYLRFHLHQGTDGLLTPTQRAGAVPADLPQPGEMHDLLQLMAARGACKVRLVGDDPGRRADLGDLLKMLSGLEGVGEVALTTQGDGLRGRVSDLARAGLRSVNFNLDTLRPERYAALASGDGNGDGAGRAGRTAAAGREGHAAVWEALEEALGAGVRVKINCVLRAGVNLDEVDDFVALTQDRPVEVRFVEWNASNGQLAAPEDFVPTSAALALIKPSLVHRESEPFAGPALRFEVPGHIGGLGFIANVTDHFCADCNRLTLTDRADLASCIFGRGIHLLRLLRSTGGIESVDALIDRVVRRKMSLGARLNGWDTPGAALPATLS